MVFELLLVFFVPIFVCVFNCNFSYSFFILLITREKNENFLRSLLICISTLILSFVYYGGLSCRFFSLA